MRTHIAYRSFAAVALAVAASATAVRAQTDTARTAVIDSWSPFIGCWSTSSGGAVGPMVCVVPSDSQQRVEFLTVADDSIVARTVVDASGRTRQFAHGTCATAESARWSDDGRRLFMHAETRCAGGHVARSDAIIARSRSDAFSHIETITSSRTASPRVVNFIVQLDSTVFPAEVKRRLPYYRPLALEETELTSLDTVVSSAIVEAASEVDPSVVEAWLADRGQRSDFDLRTLRTIQAAALGRERPRNLRPLGSGGSLAWLTFNRLRDPQFGVPLFMNGAFYDQVAANTSRMSYVITPEMVGFGLPYVGYSGGFTWGGFSR